MRVVGGNRVVKVQGSATYTLVDEYRKLTDSAAHVVYLNIKRVIGP